MSKNRLVDLTIAQEEWSHTDMAEEIKGILAHAAHRVENILETQQDEYADLEAQNHGLRKEIKQKDQQISKFELQVSNGQKQLQLMKNNEKLRKEQKVELRRQWKENQKQIREQKEENARLKVELFQLGEEKKQLEQKLKAKSDESFAGWYSSKINSNNFEEATGFIVFLIDNYQSFILNQGDTAAHVNALWEMSSRAAKDSHNYSTLLARIFSDEAKRVAKGEKGYVKIGERYAALKNCAQKSGERITQEG